MSQRIEIISQPEKREAKGNVLDKLEDLVKKNPDDAPEQYDQDGFEIPQGKIPLDGNFSSNEIKELVDLAKESEILSDSVEVKVLSRNEVVGDTVRLEEKPDESNEPER